MESSILIGLSSLVLLAVLAPVASLAQDVGVPATEEPAPPDEQDQQDELSSPVDAEAAPNEPTVADVASVTVDPTDDGARSSAGDQAPSDEELSDTSGEQEADEVADPARAIRYFVERVEVVGNTVTQSFVVRRFVPLEPGDVLDVDDPAIETIRWRLLGTGYFDDVRLRLRRGSRRGWVVLVIEVQERNTMVIQQLALGVSQGVSRTTDRDAELLPYAGITVAERNLLGLGMELSVTAAASARQQGFMARFNDPVFLGSSYGLSIGGFFMNGLEFFGHDDVLVSIVCPEPDPGEPPEECPEEVLARNAVVFYKRYGLSLGTGHDLGASTRYTLQWQPELLNVSIRPDAASEVRGLPTSGVAPRAPIDFSVEDGVSIISSVQLGLIYDRRNDPGLPSRGSLVRFGADLAMHLLGSDYSFLRLQVLLRHWVPLPWGEHHIRLGAFAGAVFGEPPFFYRFHASDLSDLIPSRVLGMNLDRRPPPDLLGTSIAEMRSQEVAGRIDMEYGLPLYRGDGGVRAVNAYFAVGLYALADRRDLRATVPGYEGLARIPVDLTFDLGARMDTNIGVFQLGFSNLLGFITP